MCALYFFCNWQINIYDEQAHAYKYLANYHLKANQLEKACHAAQKCTEFFEVHLPFTLSLFVRDYQFCSSF